MKKILISMLAIAALASCSKNENDTNGNNDKLVPIRLGAGVETKAPVTSSASVQIEGWENAGAADYSVASTWQSDATVSVSATASAITLNPVRYYNADENTTTYIKGWYPKIASSTGTVTIPNADGTVDVLLSNAVSGNKTNAVTADMKFEHQTAQLIFKVIKGEGLAADTKIKSIAVKNASVPTSIALATDVVTYTATSPLAVPSLTATEIGSIAAVVGQPLMVQKVDDNTTLKLDIETLKADGTTTAASYTDVAFTTDNSKIEMGKAYTITLTFGQAGIEIKAHITDWVSAAGSGTVQ